MIGEVTGRSENVQDTHRSSMVEKRHLEQKSLIPLSRDETIQSDDDLDIANSAANEQLAMQMKYQSIRNKRTNSLHQSRDASFLSNYNASLIGMNTSVVYNGQQKKQPLQKLTLMVDDEDHDDKGGISEVNREGKLQSQMNNIISPISRSSKNYFSQNQVVSLVNCQKVEQKFLQTVDNQAETVYEEIEPIERVVN